MAELVNPGAGPQGLSLCCLLLQKRPRWRSRLRIVDPSGSWMSRWHRQMERCDIPYLRPPLAPPSHSNPHALRRFAQQRQRSRELEAPDGLPHTGLFGAFCRNVVEEFQLVAQVQPVSLAEIQVGADGPGSLQPGLSDGSRIQARRLVIATGPGEPVLPSWVHRIAGSYPIEAMQHSQAIDLAACGGLQGQHILLVGGGLSSAHLALGAIRRGARVSLLCRRDLRWPGTTVHLMGGLAALQLGPAARNLFGGREAAHRICRTAIKT